MIMQAKKSKTLAYIANPIGSPPKAPAKPKYHTIKNPKKEDLYTKDKGTELIKNLELRHNENLNYFNILDNMLTTIQHRGKDNRGIKIASINSNIEMLIFNSL